MAAFIPSLLGFIGIVKRHCKLLLRVQGLGFRVQGLGYRGSVFRVQD